MTFRLGIMFTRIRLFFICVFLGSPVKIGHNLIRAVGLVFIISSIFKWFSIQTFSLTVDQFRAFLGYEWLCGNGLVLAVLICVTELLIGVAAFIRKFWNYVVWVYPIVLSYFTYITYLNVKSLYGQIESCGCFGEIIHVTPLESFWKNVALLAISIAALALMNYRRYIND